MNAKLPLAALAVAVTVFISACNDEGNSASVVPPSPPAVTQVVGEGEKV